MAPEQLEGRSVDSRTEILRFGAVLYEMITGRRAFEGESQASRLAPSQRRAAADCVPFSRLPRRRSIGSSRSASRRIPTIAGSTARDLLDELKWVAETASQPVTTSGVVQGAAVSGVGPQVSGLRTTITRRADRGRAVSCDDAWISGGDLTFGANRSTRRCIAVPSGPPTYLSGPTYGRLALSPNGRRLAFTAPAGNGRVMLWVRALDSLVGQPLAGTESAASPFGPRIAASSRFLPTASSRKSTLLAGRR